MRGCGTGGGEDGWFVRRKQRKMEIEWSALLQMSEVSLLLSLSGQ